MCVMRFTLFKSVELLYFAFLQLVLTLLLSLIKIKNEKLFATIEKTKEAFAVLVKK